MRRAKFRLVKCELHAENSSIIVRIGGKDMFVKVGAPGRHIVQNALAVLGAAQLVGADLEKVGVRDGDTDRRKGARASGTRFP